MEVGKSAARAAVPWAGFRSDHMAGAIATGQEPQCLLDSPFCSRSHTFPSALKLHPALSCTPGTSHYCQPLRYSGVTWLVGERTTSPLAQRETCHTALMERQLSVIYRIPDRGCRAQGLYTFSAPGWDGPGHFAPSGCPVSFTAEAHVHAVTSSPHKTPSQEGLLNPNTLCIFLH